MGRRSGSQDLRDSPEPADEAKGGRPRLNAGQAPKVEAPREGIGRKSYSAPITRYQGELPQHKWSERLSPSLWFTLYHLLTQGAGARPIMISTTRLSKSLGCSQQSASRHLRLLEDLGLLSRRIKPDGSLLRITEDGLNILGEVYHNLKRYLEGEEAESLVFEGRVFSGLCEGAYYLSLPGYRAQIKEKLGFDPYPGTLNLRISEEDVERRRRLDRLPSIRIEGFMDMGRGFGGARCYPLLVNEEVEGALIVADRSSYKSDVMEIISPIYLRGRFKLEDGDWVRIRISNPLRSSSLS